MQIKPKNWHNSLHTLQDRVCTQQLSVFSSLSPRPCCRDQRTGPRPATEWHFNLNKEKTSYFYYKRRGGYFTLVPATYIVEICARHSRTHNLLYLYIVTSTALLYINYINYCFLLNLIYVLYLYVYLYL